ncbi:MAG: hypothetical protein IT366_00615 [Candidatus Hydrogenedentes bacterium]|nr:hypothetical protein [Candidatus Hydrogenedentota bacterium]
MSPNLHHISYDAVLHRNGPVQHAARFGVAALAIVTGAIWIAFILFQSEYQRYVSEITPFRFILCWPGLMAVLYGIKLAWHVRKTAITRAIGYTFFCLTCFISLPVYNRLYFDLPSESIWLPMPISIYILAIVTVLPYIWLSKALFRLEKLEYGGLYELFGKPFVFLISFLICSKAAFLLRFAFPIDMDHPELATPLNLLYIFGPIVFAWFPYRVFLKLLRMTKNRHDHTGTTHA